MIIKELEERGLISPPSWLSTNTHFLTIMGSVAYGVSSDTSDMDLYGFATPKKEQVFPHLAGEIQGFGTQIPKFDQWQKHHVNDPTQLSGKGRVYDFTIFNIVRYFQLLMENNPNIVDSLFTPQECVLHITEVGTMVKESKHIFLHQGMYPKFKGYAYSQLTKMNVKNHENLNKIRKFEQEHGIPNTVTFEEVKNEISKRKIKILVAEHNQ